MSIQTTYKNGREKVLPIVAAFLHENFPSQLEKEARILNTTKERLQKSKNTEKINLISSKARVNIFWREKLAERLALHEDEIVRATNTILEMIEETIEKEGTIRIKSLGDFTKKAMYLGFEPSSIWKKELGRTKLGIQKPKGRLTRVS